MEPITVNLSERSLPWIEKYRPTNLNDLISHSDIINTLKRFLSCNKLPHLLFYGPPGSGKTSTVLSISKEIYKIGDLSSHVLELNASDDRGIDTVRNKITYFASTKPLGNYKFKMIILDEADQMTNDAQNSLRRVIERYTATTRFCIICNYLSKIIPAIQSRCTRFRFAPLDTKFILPKLKSVCEKEKVVMDESGEKAVLALCDGDMRRVLNILQTCSMSNKTIDENLVYSCVGRPLPLHIETIVDTLFNKNFTTSFNEVFQLMFERRYALADVLTDLHLFVHRIDMGSELRIDLIDGMSVIEQRIMNGSSDKIQLAGLVSLFENVKENA